MKKLLSLFTVAIVLISFLISNTSCKKEEPVVPKPQDEISVISQFVYDGMSTLYLWADEITNEKPTVADVDPKNYFYKILNSTDTKHGWSWITDDVESLVAEFSGEPKTFGYTLSFTQIGNTIFAIVKYVYANTPASKAGLQRLDLIGKINGQPITTEKGNDGKYYISSKDINVLYGSNPATFTTYKISNNEIVQDKEVQITPMTVKTDPVLFDKILTIDNKKIGYLFYTSFIGNFNYRLHEVFTKFKQEGVTDLVLDLRYNHGGDISAATYLASMIAPAAEVENKTTFTLLEYNKDIGKNNYRLGTYNEKDKVENGKLVAKAEPNPLTANLNLNKIYVIATEDSYSASELTPFCLRQFVDVVHIGGKTGGKYTASITIHAYDDNLGFPLYPEVYPKKTLSSETKNTLKNWAMQPIVAKYTDNNGNDFIATNGLVPNYQLEEGFGYIDYWKGFGDTSDVLLGQALYLITGNESYKPVEPKATRSATTRMTDVYEKELMTPQNIRKESVNLDHIKLNY